MDIENEVKKRLEKVLEPNSYINFVDERGDKRHFLLEVASKSFEGKSRLERQRMMYAQLEDLIKKDYIHALRLKLSLPQQ